MWLACEAENEAETAKLRDAMAVSLREAEQRRRARARASFTAPPPRRLLLACS